MSQLQPTRPTTESPKDNRTTPLVSRILTHDGETKETVSNQGTHNSLHDNTPAQTTSNNNVPLNSPGHWKGPFIGHSRRSRDATTLANETYHEHKELGLDSWLDVRMADTSTPAMEEGVKNSSCFLAIVTGPSVSILIVPMIHQKVMHTFVGIIV